MKQALATMISVVTAVGLENCVCGGGIGAVGVGTVGVAVQQQAVGVI